MASGKPTQDPPGLHATRQMLDELDALMERMLALPVNEADEPASPPAPAPASPVAPAAIPALQAPHTTFPPSRFPPLQAPAEPSYDSPAIGAGSVSDGLLRTAPPLPPLSPVLPQAPPSLTERVTAVPAGPAVAVPSAGNLDVPELPDAEFLDSWFILPLIWGNRLFDRSTYLLGDPGGWLRGPGGRTAVGLAGLLMLTAAGLWLMRDWLGWIW